MIAATCHVCRPNEPIPLPPEGYPGHWGIWPGAPISSTDIVVDCPTVPSSAVVGGADTVVSVIGRNFTPTCQVVMDGVPQASTVYVSSTLLTFVVKPSSVTAPKTSTITVIDTAAP